MYTEFIIIYAALAVILLLLIALFIMVIRLLKNSDNRVYFPTGGNAAPPRPTYSNPERQAAPDRQTEQNVAFCVSCGAVLSPEQKFCPKCGNKR